MMLLIFGVPAGVLRLCLSVRGLVAGAGSCSAASLPARANYQDLLSDPVFTGSIAVTLIYTAAAVAAEMVLAALVSRCC